MKAKNIMKLVAGPFKAGALRATRKTGWMILAGLLAGSPLAQAQEFNRPLNVMSVDGIKDMGEIKLLAANGNLNAQLKIANACKGSRLYADALRWFSMAADRGVPEAQYQKARILLYGCQDGDSAAQNVTAKPAEGFSAIYAVATNGQNGAWSDVANALKDGRGCSADIVSAYAWFLLSASAGNDASHNEMNEIALRLSVEDIRRAQGLCTDMKANRWPPLPQGQMSENPDSGAAVPIKLTLGGETYSPGGNLAIINNRTLGEGESSQFPADNKDLVTVTCTHIEQNSVQVLVAGEAGERTLVLVDH